MKICVIIPTYNESKDIGGLIKKIQQLGLDVLVVDDGSSDKTFEIAQTNAVAVLKNEVNQGKGASLIRGFEYALQKGYEAVITMDGDGQHLTEDIPYFMRVAEHSDSAVFVGNRMNQTKDMPLIRILTNKFMSWLISGIIKQRIPDTQCGFRLIKRGVMGKWNLKTDRYEIESEILIQAFRLGYKIESVPIRTVYRREKSQINPFGDTLRFIRYIIKEL